MPVKNISSQFCAKPVLICALLIVSIASSLYGGQSDSVGTWAAWQFLLGDWTGEGVGVPGQGAGTFSFRPDLQKAILVRENHSEYPATKDRQAFSHDDLMIIYHESSGPTRAVYFDNESHVIHYTVQFSGDSNTVTFLSDAIPMQPRFKLTYKKQDGNSLRISFYIAPPGKPEDFSRYIDGEARR
jgi:hypothetical protein